MIPHLRFKRTPQLRFKRTPHKSVLTHSILLIFLDPEKMTTHIRFEKTPTKVFFNPFYATNHSEVKSLWSSERDF